MVFIQKRIDKKIVFWTTNLQPSDDINMAARYVGFDDVSLGGLDIIKTWINDEGRRANFNTVIVPVCIDEDSVEPNELGEKQEPTTITKHLQMTENIKASLKNTYWMANESKAGSKLSNYIDFTTDTDLVRRVQKMEKDRKEETIPW